MSALGTAPSSAGRDPRRDGDALYEVVNGRVEDIPMSFLSTWLTFRLARWLVDHVEPNRLGTVIPEAMFILNAATDLRRRPDVAFVSAQRWPLDRPFPDEGDLEVVPDLAAEVVSPNDLAEKVQAKVVEYFRHGCRLVWVIYPATKQVHVYTEPTLIRVLTVADTLDGGDVVPGWSVPVARLFSRASEAATANGGVRSCQGS